MSGDSWRYKVIFLSLFPVRYVIRTGVQLSSYEGKVTKNVASLENYFIILFVYWKKDFTVQFVVQF